MSNLVRKPQALTQCRIVFASLPAAPGIDFRYVQVTGDETMSLARPFHVMIVFAAFLFVGAIVIGAL